MKIEESTYYLNLTAPLRVPSLAKNVRFSSEGMSYTSDGMAFILTRPSKNRYEVLSIENVQVFKNVFENARDAVQHAIRLVKHDVLNRANLCKSP